MKMKSQSFELKNEEMQVVPKGSADRVFLFISEYFHRSFSPGFHTEGSLREIPVPDTIAMKLFFEWFHAMNNGYTGLVLEFTVEQAFYSILCGEEKITQQEITELVLTKMLLRELSTFSWNELITKADEIENLSGFLCSSESRRDVTVHLEKAKLYLEKFRKNAEEGS
jgi:hypothetical protein